MQFHSRHGKGIEVTDGGYVSVARCPTGGDPCKCNLGTPRQWSVFSDRPIKPEKSLELEVQEGEVCGWEPHLWIGVTSVTPADWDLSVWPYRHRDTWMMSTIYGEICINGDHAGWSTEWEGKFGTRHELSPRDRIRLSLTTDRSVSITYKGTEFTRIFTNLPDGDLWVVIYQVVKSLRMIPTDPAQNLQELEELSLTEPAADPVVSRLPVTLNPQPILWDTFPPTVVPANMRAGTQFFRTIHGKIKSGKVYQTNKAMKGKACIISLPRFEVPWLRDLPGYDVDRINLTSLWRSLGFEVYVPKISAPRCLTAMETRVAVQSFASKLTRADQVAVLCVMSHGKDRYIWGSDGNEVHTTELLSYLDNRRCRQMMDKPKISIIQACQGGSADGGATSYAPAATEELIPTVSDMVTCYPSMPGCVSYVHPTEGSIYIKNFVQVVKENVANTNIYELLTEVNGAVKKECKQGMVQMSNFQSCLDKHLYLLPTTSDFNL